MTILAIGQSLSCVEVKGGTLAGKDHWVLLNKGQWTKVDICSAEKMRLGA